MKIRIQEYEQNMCIAESDTLIMEFCCNVIPFQFTLHLQVFFVLIPEPSEAAFILTQIHIPNLCSASATDG